MTTRMIRPGDLKPGMIVVNSYVVLGEPQIDPHGAVQIRVRYTDGGISVRGWDPGDAKRPLVPVIDE